MLGIAALMIHALLPGLAPRPSLRCPLDRTRATPLMLALIARLLLPLAAMVSVYLFLRGHNQPGGGFIAGLVLAIALMMQFVANGQRFVVRAHEYRLPPLDRLPDC